MMESKEPITAFENTAQRVVFSYQRQLPEFAAVLPEPLSPSEQQAMQASQRELGAFFRAFYQRAHDQPELFGMPLTEDVYVKEEDSKETKQKVTKQTKKSRTKLAHGLDFLYLAGQQGTLVDNHLRLDQQSYASFFAKNPRVKKKIVKGMQEAGLTVSEQDDAVVVGNAQYPNMMLALKALADACLQRDDKAMAKFLFARCDFRALDADYQPDVLDMLQAVLSPSEHKRAVELHHTLAEMAYTPILKVDSPSRWSIYYQGKRAIKATPLFEFEYDERLKSQRVIRVKCASTNRLVPLLVQQPAILQQDFYHHANACGGSQCGWCKTRKGLGPSRLEYDGEKKTICWYMQRHFHNMDNEMVNLVRHYALLHEALLAA